MENKKVEKKCNSESVSIELLDADEDICGYCGEKGADKMALWTGGGVYWPGEFRPDTELVHQSCEHEEQRRAHRELTQEQRNKFLRSI